MNFWKNTKENPWHFVLSLWSRGLLVWVLDKLYLKLMYRAIFGKKLDLNNPMTFVSGYLMCHKYQIRSLHFPFAVTHQFT